jgi:hypothetical protein
VDNFLKNEPTRTHQTPTRPSMTKRKDSQVWHELSSTITQPVDISDIRIAGEHELTVNDNPWHVENESYQGVNWVQGLQQLIGNTVLHYENESKIKVLSENDLFGMIE